jgi:hypothetical protein
MTIKRPNVSFKTRNDVFDSITPNSVVQPEIAVPAGEWKPARYLPVQWTGEASKDAFIISKGKIVCFDNAGRIADMYFKAKAAAAQATTDVMVTYDSIDAEYGVHNVATGEVCAASDASTLLEVAEGLVNQGLVIVGRDVTAAPVDLPTAQAVCEAFWSAPIGVAAYDVYAWAGDAPQELVFTNYQKQHLIQFFTEVQMRAPLVVDAASTTLTVSANPTRNTTFVGATAGEAIEASAIVALERYAALQNTEFVALVLAPEGIAANTDRTPITCDIAGELARERNSADMISSPGDFWVDAEVGLVFVHAASGSLTNALINAGGRFTFHKLDSAASTQHKYVHAVGPVRPGDSLTYDMYSNFVKATTGQTVVARVLAIETQPKGLLDRVSTAWHGSSFDAAAKMPGSATKGFTDMITLSSESVADTIITMNVRV